MERRAGHHLHRVPGHPELAARPSWRREGFTGGDRLLTLYGGMDPHDREAVKAAFQAAPDVSPVRILLATDAASEGIDLQNHCSRLIHYEIPWNPNRMEQRNGRIDRHGQKARAGQRLPLRRPGLQGPGAGDFSESAGDLEGDLEFLMRAPRKVEQIREDLGKVGPVIAEQVEEAMLGRRTTLNTAQAEKDAEPVRRMLKFERDLAKQIKALHGAVPGDAEGTAAHAREHPEGRGGRPGTGRPAAPDPARPTASAGPKRTRLPACRP